MPERIGTGSMRKFRSLTVTLAIAFLALSLGVLLTATLLSTYFNTQDQQRAVAEQQHLIAQEAAKTVTSFIEGKLNILEVAISIGDLPNAGEGERKLAMDKVLGLEPAFRQLMLLDPQGEELLIISRLSSMASIKLAEEIENDIFSRTRLGERYISSVYIDQVTSEPMVIMAVPTRDVFGDFKGVLVAEVNLKFMWDVVDKINIGDSGLAYVVDREGNLIAFGDTSRVLKLENLLYLKAVSEFSRGNASAAESPTETTTGIEGREVVANYVPLGTPDWAVVVEMPVEEALEPVTRSLLMSVSVILLNVILAIVAGIYLSRRITRPVIKLRNFAEKVGKGNLNEPVEVKSRDEIGELAYAFKNMVADLKQSHEKIEKHAEELETKVQQRTRELDEKVNELTGTKTAMLNMMEDMDEANKQLVQTQEELKDSLKELKEMDVKKDQFISIAAHELKTPLTSIHGFSQLLQNRKVANDFTKRNKYLKIMDHETKRLAKLVTDILDLSRIDLGTVKFSFEEVDVNKLMEDVKKEMDVQIKAKKLPSEYDIEKDMPNIVTDREKLTEILINLINNAIKYTPKGKITVNVSRDEENVHFVVKDTGIGIAKENHEKIFERFYQVDSSHTRKTSGVGLGLALCKEFLNILGGEMWVKSETGKGSEFHFTLPIKKVPKEFIREGERKAREALKKSEETRKKVKKQDLGKGNYKIIQ